MKKNPTALEQSKALAARIASVPTSSLVDVGIVGIETTPSVRARTTDGSVLVLANISENDLALFAALGELRAFEDLDEEQQLHHDAPDTALRRLASRDAVAHALLLERVATRVASIYASRAEALRLALRVRSWAVENGLVLDARRSMAGPARVDYWSVEEAPEPVQGPLQALGLLGLLDLAGELPADEDPRILEQYRRRLRTALASDEPDAFESALAAVTEDITLRSHDQLAWVCSGANRDERHHRALSVDTTAWASQVQVMLEGSGAEPEAVLEKVLWWATNTSRAEESVALSWFSSLEKHVRILLLRTPDHLSNNVSRLLMMMHEQNRAA